MSTLEEIEAAAETLPAGEKQALLEFLAANLQRANVTPADRVPGLHAGAWEVAADFDAPLADEFWLGRDA